jgi:hypothetical protein
MYQGGGNCKSCCFIHTPIPDVADGKGSALRDETSYRSIRMDDSCLFSCVPVAKEATIEMSSSRVAVRDTNVDIGWTSIVHVHDREPDGSP